MAPFYHPGPDSPEIQYMLERRRQLGGPLPQRRVDPDPLKLPGDEMYAELKRGSGKQAIATTMAFVRLLRDLMKDPEIGHRFVPIAPDEFRTFGMDSMFPTAKIYSPHGQQYDSVDRKMLLTYKESKQGQMLHEGISELGGMGSTIAAGTSYATHGEPMIPVYLFYSMFGFQRTGDWMWALGDNLGRGFLIGATSGRTTLTGEGLQHADGHSPLLAATNPACVYYDPAFAYEISHIVQDGLRRMYGSSDDHPHGEDVFYYLSVYNEPTVQLPEPEGVDAEGILRGIHLAKPAETSDGDDRPADPAARLRSGRSVGDQGSAASRGRVAGPGRCLVGDLLERARTRRARHRLVEPAPPRRGPPDPLHNRQARPDVWTGLGGKRLHEGGARPDRPVGTDRLALVGHRRVRLR